MDNQMDPVPINTSTNLINNGPQPQTPIVQAPAETIQPAQTAPFASPSVNPTMPQQAIAQPYSPQYSQQPFQPQMPFQPNPYGFPPANPYFNQQMPYMPMQMGMGMNMGNQMPMQPGFNQEQKKKVGIFGGFIVPAIILIIVLAASYYGYNYIQVSSTTQITKAQITNKPPAAPTTESTTNTEDTTTTVSEDPTTPDITSKTEDTSPTTETPAESKKVGR